MWMRPGPPPPSRRRWRLRLGHWRGSRRGGIMGEAKAHYDGVVAFSQTDSTEELNSGQTGGGPAMSGGFAKRDRSPAGDDKGATAAIEALVDGEAGLVQQPFNSERAGVACRSELEDEDAIGANLPPDAEQA